MHLSERFPEDGLAKEQVIDLLAAASLEDVDWSAGLHQGACYLAGDDVLDVSWEAYRRFYHANPLVKGVFPSMRRFEEALIAALAELLHSPSGAGIITSGGTESNLLAVWSAVVRGLARGVAREQATIVLPYSAHPSFTKAATYFGLRIARIPTGPGLGADVSRMEEAIDDTTVLVVGSAPSYPHGILDPIEELGDVTVRRGVDLHVDACVGGMVLPFLTDLGRECPPFDFRVPGVTTISTDLHKHGYSAKGVSALLHREDGIRDAAAFSFDDWPNGRYATNTITGTRSGGSIASAFAVMMTLGRSGYRSVVEQTMASTDRFRSGIEEIDGFQILGSPIMNKFAFGSERFDMMLVADAMAEMGWSVGRQSHPPAINMHVGLMHAPIIDRYLSDLASARSRVLAGEVTSSGEAGSYT